MYNNSVPALISKNVGNTLSNYKTWGGILYDVKEYGAKGDGTTDDTTKVQAAIDAAIANNDIFVYFPYGIYKVTSLTNADQVYFLGDGATFSGVTNVINQSWRGLFNATSLTYGGATSQVHVKNDDGEVTMTLQHSEASTNTTPLDTLRIYRNISSLGGSSLQQGGAIVRSTVNSGVNHNEFGFFSVLDNYAEAATEQVGMYSQITNRGNAQSTIWGGVFEARNWDGTTTADTVNTVITGIEVDVVNNRAFSDTIKKIGVEAIAYGGGENTEAFSVYAGNNTRGNGTYNSGHWRYGFRILSNAIDATSGIGLQISSSHGTGIEITGASANYAINLQANAATTTGINIGSNYTNPIAIQADKKIKLNSESNTQGVYWDSTNSAVTFAGASIGVAGHTNYNSASAGGTQAVPATVSGYIGVYVNGFLKKVPYFNT